MDFNQPPGLGGRGAGVYQFEEAPHDYYYSHQMFGLMENETDNEVDDHEKDEWEVPKNILKKKNKGRIVPHNSRPSTSGLANGVPSRSPTRTTLMERPNQARTQILKKCLN